MFGNKRQMSKKRYVPISVQHVEHFIDALYTCTYLKWSLLAKITYNYPLDNILPTEKLRISADIPIKSKSVVVKRFCRTVSS